MREETNTASSYTIQSKAKYNFISVYMSKTFQE